MGFAAMAFQHSPICSKALLTCMQGLRHVAFLGFAACTVPGLDFRALVRHIDGLNMRDLGLRVQDKRLKTSDWVQGDVLFTSGNLNLESKIRRRLLHPTQTRSHTQNQNQAPHPSLPVSRRCKTSSSCATAPPSQLS